MKQRLFSFQFFLLCASGLLFFSSFNMIIPELPNYLSSLGGADYKGLIIALFTITAGVSRPFSGKLTDTIGRIPVMVIGALVCVVCGFIYPAVNSVFAFLALRLFHGFSTGFKPTGTAAYVADIVPGHRRGEAMGILGFSSSLGIALGPVLGSIIASAWGLDAMFYTSSAFSFLSVFILVNMRETLEERQRFSLNLLRVHKQDFYQPRVLPPAIVMLFSVYGFGVVLTVTPDISDYLGLQNKGLFFAFFTIASLFVRIFLGKLSDKFGREPIITLNLIGIAASFVFIGFADSINTFLIGAVLLGASVGGLSPTVFAWAIDLSDPKALGRSMATLYISLEIGIGCGAFFSGIIYNNHMENMVYVFLAAACGALISMTYMLVFHRRSSMVRRP